MRIDLDKLMEESLVGASAPMKEYHRDKSEFLRNEVTNSFLLLVLNESEKIDLDVVGLRAAVSTTY